MKKKISIILAAVGIAAMMLFSSCTDAGMELYLTGDVWQCEENGVTHIIELTDKDAIKYKTKVGKAITTVFSGKVKSVEGKKIKFVCNESKLVEIEGVLEYKDLTCKNVKFKLDDGEWKTYKCAF
jgi:hypothetical protein